MAVFLTVSKIGRGQSLEWSDDNEIEDYNSLNVQRRTIYCTLPETSGLVPGTKW